MRRTSVHPAGSDVRIDEGLAEERARALGRAGRRLEDALAAHQRAVAAHATDAEIDARLDAIAAALYRLLVQRECAGARHGNLEAIQAVYDLPPEAVRRV